MKRASAWLAWAAVAVLAAAGFAAFAPSAPSGNAPSSDEVQADADQGVAAGRITALALTGSIARSQTTTTVADSGPATIGPCEASWYGPGFVGRRTSSGETFDPDGLTGATHHLPFDTLVTVSRLDTGDAVTVRINDRGPYERRDGDWYRHPSRCIDLSEAAMSAIGGLQAGVVQVVIEIPAGTVGADDLQRRFGAS